MVGIEDLLDAFQTRGLARPSHQDPNIVDLARAVARLSGVDANDRTVNSSVIEQRIGPADHLVLVLLDGVGMVMLENLSHDSFLRGHLVDELSTVFPSTTSVALTTLATGAWPAEHGVTGWWTHISELGQTAVILRYVTRSDDRDLAGLGMDVETVFPLQSAFASYDRDTLLLMPAAIADSTYSAYFSGGRPTTSYGSLDQGISTVIRRIADAGEPTFTYLYVSQVDSLAHLHGMTRPEVLESLREVDAELARLHSAIGDKGRIVVTADHGFLDAPAASRHTLRPSTDLTPLLHYPPSGDTRVMYLHVRDWARARVRGHFERKFGSRFYLISVDEAEDLELFGPGPLAPATKDRMGDLIAISSGAHMIEYNAARGSARSVLLNGHHSGLTPDEMKIPLVIA